MITAFFYAYVECEVVKTLVFKIVYTPQKKLLSGAFWVMQRYLYILF